MLLNTYPSTLRLTSCQAPNADPALSEIVRFVGDQLNMPVQFDLSIGWQERLRQLDAGEVHAGWICGTPYLWRVERPEPQIELLVAPVMRSERYAGRPVYFSDVVVHAESRFQCFADLRGATWSINECGSHSGYNIVRYHLATLGEPRDFFGTVVEAGAHQHSLRLIIQGDIDASAIDSTVLDCELRNDPALEPRLRRIATLGPSPIPPWVVQRSLPQPLKAALRSAFLSLSEDTRGRSLLAAGDYARFVTITDQDYDALREMTRLAQTVTL
jgi:phosphonate transport system substrate-binding protein